MKTARNFICLLALGVPLAANAHGQTGNTAAVSRQTDAATSSTLDVLRAAIARHESTLIRPYVKYQITLRPNPELTFKERSFFPWADGKKHQTLIEYARREPYVWFRNQTYLKDGFVNGHYDWISDGQRVVHHSRYSREEFVLQDRQLDYAVPPSPFYGVFPLQSVFGPGRLLSEVLKELPDAKIDFDGEHAKLSFRYGPAKNFAVRFEIWYARELDWFPVRLHRYQMEAEEELHSAWRISRLARAGDDWYVAEGTIDWWNPRTVARGKRSYSEEFEVMAIEFDSDFPPEVFRVQIPDDANVRDQRIADAAHQSAKEVPSTDGKTRPLKLMVQDIDGKPITGAEAGSLTSTR